MVILLLHFLALLNLLKNCIKKPLLLIPTMMFFLHACLKEGYFTAMKRAIVIWSGGKKEGWMCSFFGVTRTRFPETRKVFTKTQRGDRFVGKYCKPESTTDGAGYKLSEVKKGLRQEKLVALIGVEGGHMIENDLEKLEALYQRACAT